MRKIKSKRITIFKTVYPFIRSDKKSYLAICILQVWAMALSIISPLLYLVLVNNIMIDKKLILLPMVIVGYIIIYLLDTLGVVMKKRSYNKLFLKFNIKIKTQLLIKYTKISIKKYEEYDVGDLKNRIDGDVSSLENFLNSHIIGYLYAIVSAIVITIILFIMNPILAAISIIIVPISFWFVKIMGNKVQKVSEEQRNLQGSYNSFLHSTFQNWKEIKSNNLEKNQNEILQNFRVKLSKLFIKNQIYVYINRTFIDFKDFFITKMNLYFIGGLLIIGGQMDVGILLVFMNYYAQLFSNIGQVTDSILGLKSDTPNIDRVLEILDIKILEKPKIKLESEITLSKLCFKYNDNQKMVLNNINLSVCSNENIGIVGRSGCGKTTLARLIIGIYEPLSGDVIIGGHNIKQISFDSIIHKIGIVLQDPPMFNLTIEDNLRFAKKRATKDELINVCKQANIYDFIEKLPDKFDTIIGEHGIKLSGGQKQRLSIARTLLQNPDIIIFDEATSSLDSENEMAIVKAINELSKGKTIITIAHRLSTLKMCDRIVVLNEGKIMAIDSHENLRGKNEIYDLLFEKQYRLV